jgi:hypothetical protein
MAIPSLAMIPSGYKATKLYSVLPTDGVGDFTVSRPTGGAGTTGNATRTNSAGLLETMGANVPRLDYSDGGCPALLTEPQATNLLTYSNDFSQTIWIKQNGLVAITPNAIISPDGTLNADLATWSSVASLYQGGIAVVSGVEYSYSIYLKGIQGESIGIWIEGWGGVSRDVVIFTGQWQKYTKTITASTTSLFSNFAVRRTSLEQAENVYIYGAQAEQNSHPTSYIQTNGAIETRVADVVSVAVPSGVTEIIETIDNVEQTPITVIPATYTVPNGNINKIIMN